MYKLIASLSLLICISSNAHAGKLEKGEVYSGEIKKVEHYLYNLNLPKGDWEVLGIDRILSHNNESYIILGQIIEGELSAIIWLDFITDPSEYGWYTPDSSVCNDWEDQNSNYHKSTYKRKLANAVSKGSCISVWVDNDIYEGSYDWADEFEQAKIKLRSRNIELPSAILWIDQLLITKEAYAGIYIGINPKHNADIYTRSRIGYTYSEWHSYNIDSYERKKNYMDKAINASKAMNEQNYKALEKRKVMDLRFIDRLLK